MTLAAANPVAFVLTRDRAKAKAFYVGTLGLRLVSEDEFAAVFDLNGTMMRLTTVETHQPHPHTVIGWDVKDIDAAAKDLMAKGVTFNIYPGFGQDERGIWTAPDRAAKVAWFNDPDGNVLSLSQH
ncbi:MAG: VOC family protein [Alphaproteobacteria bacterium]|nr:VOC family protein [Alphaproteobacteria bacterium]